MPDYASMFGTHIIPGRKWTPQVELSAPNVGQYPPGPYRVDPYLTGLGTDPYDPAGIVAIYSGRFVSVGNASSVNGGSNGYRIGVSATGKTPLTLHDGQYLQPAGMAVNQMYKDANTNQYMTNSNTVRYRKGFLAGVPYVTAVNDAYGTLVAGDEVTGYAGTTTSTTPLTTLHRGKPVKFIPRRVYYKNQSAAATATLSAAVYPGVTPTVVMAWNAGTAVTTGSSATVAWNSGLGAWVATFGQLVTDVLYEWGQDRGQAAGRVERIKSITDMLNEDNFLKWVEYAPSDYANFPPAMTRMPVVTVGSGSNPADGTGWSTPSTVTANVQYRLGNYPVSVHHPVLVAIQGTVVDPSGTSTTYSGGGASGWLVLPTNGLADMRGYFIGLYHNVNWRTGMIDLSASITSVTAIRALYSYISDPRDGAVLWGGGVLGLTDGTLVSSGPKYGTPMHLNIADSLGELRVQVY
jgi:hypothetical protein